MNTLIVTVDALRADHIGQYGYERDTMPVLDKLENRGTVFLNCFANGPYTRISIPSLHTSTYRGYQNIECLPTIASTLSDCGITTACIGTQTGFSSIEGELLFDNYVDLGRDEYHYRSNAHLDYLQYLRNISPRVAELIKDQLGLFRYLGYISAAEITKKAKEWIQAHTNDEFFLWLHYMEGHRPYGVHEESPLYTQKISEKRIRKLLKTAWQRTEDLKISEHKLLIDLYDSDLRYFSRHFDRLLDEMKKLDLLDETNILFTADHGEEFYDHGQFFHRNLPYDELLHVPLIVRKPDGRSNTVRKQRELVDVAPTILNFHDVKPPETFIGVDLFDDADRQVIALGSQMYDGQVIAGRWDGWKYIWSKECEFLFDLNSDILEEQNLVEEITDVRDEFRQSIPTELFRAPPEELREPKDAVDQERLEALGYLELE